MSGVLIKTDWLGLLDVLVGQCRCRDLLPRIRGSRCLSSFPLRHEHLLSLLRGIY